MSTRQASSSSTTQIAIIGGGLVGASLALALQAGAKNKGWRITLIEPFQPGHAFQPSYDARGSALSYGSQQIYHALGIWPQLKQRSQAISSVHVSEQGKFANTRLLASESGVPALGYVVENAWLGRCLWDALDPEVVEWRCPAQVEHIKVHQQGYQLSLNDGSQLTAELTILADGGRSGLREQLGIYAKVTPYQQTALISTVTPQQDHQGQAFERFTATGPLALLPLVDNRMVLIWTHPPTTAEQLSQLPDAEFKHALQREFGYRLGAFNKVGTRHLYPLNLIESSEQVRPHLVVLGNAAHSLHPIAGQGYNLSLRDCLCLANTLLASNQPLGDFATLQQYQRLQQQDQALTIGFSDQVTRLFSHSRAPLAQLRSLGLLGLELASPAKQWFAQQAMGLGGRRYV
ncbi:2-octaprenyl-6-methoxyphenyl hydroxylase [Thiopseudomonas alkaliphila]|uniref:2-octaprenyl-6-methoxyphenyl hydroxylase n=1 Tax=Thiopseudomonas alkaliphila TaxID=1697053 RepID=A0AAW7DSY4_9GAMM|nr:2-octaprenyl-6-methoxyphenyl hydroxylase [Thiopseudomonas alkaliphila]AKX55692.1 2-octaprenyl-6-methoxyphenyl hydroxylase [Thiopseudomonas alkaliphila]MDM1695846.1 2-octaprenyl-6-methoxyphenyl hydroxylase [Thiopseudomonas alkaliphila]